MHRIFQNFIDLLSNAEDADAFAQAMSVTACGLDLACFAYLALPRTSGKKPLVISTYPTNWVEHYVRKHYVRIDPIVKRALESPEPFQWGLDHCPQQITPAQREFLNEASEFGIRLGFTVPIHDGHGPIAALTFATDNRQTQFKKCVDQHARVLQLMAMYFHANVRRRLADKAAINGALLSPREFECLQWASQGKSAWEIGCILGISRNTVAYYLENAKEKLGVRTIAQAVTRLAAANKREQN